MSVVIRVIINDRPVRHLESGSVLHEGQAGFRTRRSCVDNIYVLSELVQGRLREGKKTYAFLGVCRGILELGRTSSPKVYLRRCSNGALNEHVKRVLQNCRKKISQVHSNRDIDLTARRLLLISVVRPTLEYGS